MRIAVVSVETERPSSSWPNWDERAITVWIPSL